MKKFLFYLLCALPMSAGAGVIYNTPRPMAFDSDFAARHRFYIGGTYNLSWWQNYADDTNFIRGKTEYGFDGIVGARITNNFRLEADYMYTKAKYDAFAIKTNTVFFNAILDARINELYSVFYHQHIVPYVGVGAGITWYDDDAVKVNNDMNVSVAALAGIALELGEYFAIDIGYRYVYMFKPGIDIMPKLNPAAHQVRAGLRINF